MSNIRICIESSSGNEHELEIEKKIMEEFNLEDEEIDYCEYDY